MTIVSRYSRRRGGIVVEMILVLVILVFVTVGIVQFGVFLSNAQQVSLAARIGALEATQTVDLDVDASAVPANVISVIEHQLESSGMQWCVIRLEHDVTPGEIQEELLSSQDPDCVLQTDELLDPPLSRNYVRLTVGVRVCEVMPKGVSYFCEQIFGPDQVYEHSAIFRYELETP
jgi:hypothetical protein